VPGYNGINEKLHIFSLKHFGGTVSSSSSGIYHYVISKLLDSLSALNKLQYSYTCGKFQHVVKTSVGTSKNCRSSVIPGTPYKRQVPNNIKE
jgi:hypothetical protein